MGPGQAQHPVATGVPVTSRARRPTSMPAADSATWDSRLYAGLNIPHMPAEVRAQLAKALGEVGVEAEYVLLQIKALPGPAPYSHARGEAFLVQLEAAARRLCRTSADLEVATQSYLTALETCFPGIRATGATGSAVWWPPSLPFALAGEPIELRLRRCGFAYHHVVETHLASNIEAVAEHMALVLHALTTLPPAGVAPAATLYQGLDELASTLNGYLVPHHIADLSHDTPGLLSSIARLYVLDRSQDTSLASDIAWAREQYAYVQRMSAGATQSGLSTPSGWSTPGTWAAAALDEWRATLDALERMRAGGALPPRRR